MSQLREAEVTCTTGELARVEPLTTALRRQQPDVTDAKRDLEAYREQVRAKAVQHRQPEGFYLDPTMVKDFESRIAVA